MKPAYRKRIGIVLAVLCLAALTLPLCAQPPRQAVTWFTALPVRAQTVTVPVPQGTVDVNHADLYELMELPGIGETLARNIIDEREANGPFIYPEDLLSVKGIGTSRLEAIRDLLDLTGGEQVDE